jgi:hypothetical protein
MKIIHAELYAIQVRYLSFLKELMYQFIKIISMIQKLNAKGVHIGDLMLYICK